jgi:nucleotide-binding universal stress UspA family protein
MSWVPKSCVVVPVDFSDTSNKSLQTALELVDSPENVRAIHVLHELPVTEPGVIWDTIDDEGRIAHATDAIVARLAEANCKGVESTVEIGDPGSNITQFAERVGAELIVIPSRGRSGLKHLLMGSVAERVVRLAHCPVLVLK